MSYKLNSNAIAKKKEACSSVKDTVHRSHNCWGSCCGVFKTLTDAGKKLFLIVMVMVFRLLYPCPNGVKEVRAWPGGCGSWGSISCRSFRRWGGGYLWWTWGMSGFVCTPLHFWTFLVLEVRLSDTFVVILIGCYIAVGRSYTLEPRITVQSKITFAPSKQSTDQKDTFIVNDVDLLDCCERPYLVKYKLHACDTDTWQYTWSHTSLKHRIWTFALACAG